MKVKLSALNAAGTADSVFYDTASHFPGLLSLGETRFVRQRNSSTPATVLTNFMMKLNLGNDPIVIQPPSTPSSGWWGKGGIHQQSLAKTRGSPD